jgi:hypothetical protein
MVVKEHDNFYVVNEHQKWFPYGFVLDGKGPVIRWMDIGGRKGGLSIFSKNWGTNKGNDEGVMLKLSEFSHKVTLHECALYRPGSEYFLAKRGIYPYAAS